MEINKPYLFIEINDEKFVFLVVEYNEDFNFKVIDSLIIKSEGVLQGKIIDVNASSKIIKENLNLIEKKINYTFKNTTIINNQDNFNCINISGFKKLSGSQILDTDISYILNQIKKTIVDNYSTYSLVHLFNSNFILDNQNLDNLPIGLYGDFYSHHLSFFLLPKNDLKNLKLTLNSCDVNVERIIFKTFAENLEKIKLKSSIKLSVLIKIGYNKSYISIFKNLSYIYSESFNFGSNIIMKDIVKLCSLDFNNVQNIFNDICFDSIINSNDQENYLSQNYFKNESFRKISKQHLHEIIIARVEEIINLVYKKNINLQFIRKKNKYIEINFQDKNIYKNLKLTFAKIFPINDIVETTESTQDKCLESCLSSAELIGKGWEKEALPIIQAKKSVISKIFSALFD